MVLTRLEQRGALDSTVAEGGRVSSSASVLPLTLSLALIRDDGIVACGELGRYDDNLR